MKRKSKLASRLHQQKQSKPKDTAPHLVIVARAGTGKTTTLIEGLKIVKGFPSDFVPSPQQAAIWDAMKQSDKTSSACFVAFNKSIAVELQNRVPQGCKAMTMHSMGYTAVREQFGQVELSNFRVREIVAELLGVDIYHLRRSRHTLLSATEKLVGLCKMNLQPVTCRDSEELSQGIIGGFIENQLADLASHYDIDLNGEQSEVFDLVPRVLERCKDVDRDHCIDFNDMIWLPIILDLSVYRYDLLLVDEAQDLNRCQQQLALKAGRRLILCGDPKQAIYGFAGADSQSMEHMKKLLSTQRVKIGRDEKEVPSQCLMSQGRDYQEGELPHCEDCYCVVEERGCITLPLTVTRRCGKAIVKEAKKIVPDFEAHESCGEGIVSHARFGPTQYAPPNMNDEENGLEEEPDTSTVNYQTYVENEDMILCRVNAPLVSQCFKFLRDGLKANIQGRDVGQGLISTIKKMKASTIEVLTRELDLWRDAEMRKENAKRNPSEPRMIALQDRYDCLCCFMEDQRTIEDVIKRIEDVFTNEKNGVGIMLSSIHKAKGLESKRVFLLQPEGATIPHPMARSAWQREQEFNLFYVAITRAIDELVYVS